MPLTIATWNINGVKARIEGLERWLRETAPDVVCLQEIKSLEEGFPREPLEGLGYNLAVLGQKGFNGVAILSKRPIEEVRRHLPGAAEEEPARYIEAVIGTEGGGIIRVASIYLPNGNPVGSDKFQYKCLWTERLIAHARYLLALEEPLVLAGDFNVIPEEIDASNPEQWTGDALFQPVPRAQFRRLRHLGLTDAIRACHPESHHYTFWDYQAGAWQKDNGIRIDHLMLSPQAADRLLASGIDRFTRGWEKPSDHVPVWVRV